MKKIYDLLFITLLIVVIACAPTVRSSTTDTGGDSVTSSPAPVAGKDGQADRIIFGRYCGKCRSHCATMYQLNLAGSSTTLYMDTTDSFRDHFGTPTCNTPVKDSKKLALAQSIIAKIPAELYTTENTNETFGCPDCADGCGFYVELTQGKKLKKFYIDTELSQLKDKMKDFSVALAGVTEQLAQ